MIEPTETESKETLDEFIQAMIKIAKEADEDPEMVKSAPHNTVVRRPNEVKAARDIIVKFEG
jgi:glycine dehydrogenase subunit 2